MAEHDVGTAVGTVSVIAVMEEAAEERGDAEGVEVAAGGLEVPARLRVSVGGKTNLSEAIGADGGKGTVAGAEIAIVGKRHRDIVVVAVLDEGELAGLGDGGGAEEERIDDAEDDDVGGDAEGEREDGGGGKARTAAELAQGVAEVGEKPGHGVLSCGGEVQVWGHCDLERFTRFYPGEL